MQIMDTKELYEIMYELATEENEVLVMEIDALKAYIEFLHDQNKDLVIKYNSLFDNKIRRN